MKKKTRKRTKKRKMIIPTLIKTSTSGVVVGIVALTMFYFFIVWLERERRKFMGRKRKWIENIFMGVPFVRE